MDKVKVAVLVGPHGRGSNMAALIGAGQVAEFPACVAVVIAPKSDAPALALAQSLGVATAVVPYGDDYGARMIESLGDCEWLCLAGFMRIVPLVVLRHLGGRVLNIHPALLPKHGGKGMYGIAVHEAVLAAHEEESGCTVHFVNEVYDDGRIVMQSRCPVLPTDTAESLAARVLDLEHTTYPAALRQVIDETPR